MKCILFTFASYATHKYKIYYDLNYMSISPFMPHFFLCFSNLLGTKDFSLHIVFISLRTLPTSRLALPVNSLIPPTCHSTPCNHTSLSRAACVMKTTGDKSEAVTRAVIPDICQNLYFLFKNETFEMSLGHQFLTHVDQVHAIT